MSEEKASIQRSLSGEALNMVIGNCSLFSNY